MAYAAGKRSLMKFDRVLHLLRSYRSPEGEQVLFLLAPNTMESLYDCVLSNGASACLELGTGHGTTTCVIAAALEELGGGCITTIDMVVRDPINTRALAQHIGLSQYVNVVSNPVGYDWELKDMIERQTINGACVPCFDFCFLDGAHEWVPDALAAFLVAKLLRPGSWLVLDDLDFKLRGCQPGWQATFADRSQQELDACQIDWVFNLVLRQHPDFGDFTMAECGRTGWARKKPDKSPAGPAPWYPSGRVLGPVGVEWQESFAAIDIAGDSQFSDALVVTQQDMAVLLRANQVDPVVALSDDVNKGRPIDVMSLRIRLVAPATETLQVFWVDASGDHFTEKQSVRVKITASDHWQDLVIRINGLVEPRPIHAIRLDPMDGPGTLLWHSVTVGGWHRNAANAQPVHRHHEALPG